MNAAERRVAAILLAAGSSSRLGQPKQLLPFRRTTLLRLMATEARAACDDVVVIVGARADAMREALRGADVAILHNDEWTEGMASSVRLGVAWAAARGASALVMVADQPRLDRAHLARLVDAHRNGARIAASAYAGIVGVPAVFAPDTFVALRGLRGDEGARRVLRSSRDVVAIDWPEGARDVDVAASLAFVYDE